uniref:Uncharacterized protein n=1 Tax=Aegilops tauschii subsp. strangulata TaxID=200361 RepID=A0A453SU19_AEGTS
PAQDVQVDDGGEVRRHAAVGFPAPYHAPRPRPRRPRHRRPGSPERLLQHAAVGLRRLRPPRRVQGGGCRSDHPPRRKEVRTDRSHERFFDLAEFPLRWLDGFLLCHHAYRSKPRQRSQKRRNSGKQRADREQHADEPKLSNGESPDPNKEEENRAGPAKSGPLCLTIKMGLPLEEQVLAESAIVKASTSTTSQRFSVSPMRSFLPADEPQLRRANTYHATGDEHTGGAIAHHGVAIRSAT